MMEGTLHPAPRGRDVVREQIRIVGLSLRREALVVAVVLAIGTVLVAIDIARGNAATWFDSDGWFPIGFIAFFFPFAVWRRDRPFGPAFLWTLPVDRRPLALARVFAGWVWMMTALAVFVGLERALALLSGVTNGDLVPPVAFIAATVLYLFGSALVVGLRHPLLWLLGAVGVAFLLGLLSDALEHTRGVDTLLGSRRLYHGVEDAATVWQTEWAILTFLSLGAGLAALWAAVSRHRERRRH